MKAQLKTLVAAALVGLVVASAGCRPPRRDDPILKKVKCPADMVAVGGGSFVYGDRDVPGSPPRKHYLRGFCIDRYEHPNKAGSFPTVSITWLEARAACEQLGKRLCTEYEWEKAARGREGFAYPYGPRFEPDACRYTPLTGDPAYRTGSHLRCVSSYGAADMSGGVWEWTENPFTPGKPARSIRGGSWSKDLPLSSRSAFRAELEPGSKSAEVGFRCCWTPPSEKLRKPREKKKPPRQEVEAPPGMSP